MVCRAGFTFQGYTLFTFRSLFLWIHVVTVVCWIGGIIYASFVAGPVLSGKSAMEGGGLYHERIVHRFYRLSRELLFVILLTGVFNLVNRGILVQFNFSSTYLVVIGIKFTILMSIAGLQIYYSLNVIPQLSRLLQEGRDEHETAILQLRKKAFGVASLMVTLGVAAIFMGLNLGYL